MAIVCEPALALPEHVFDEDTVRQTARAFLGDKFPRLETVLKIIKNAGVDTRYMVQSPEETVQHPGFEARNTLFQETSKRLGEQAARAALHNAGIEPKDVDLVITTSCTGLMIPSLEAYLIPKMGMRADTKRMPITELGCAAGAVAMSRAREYCAVYPGSNVLIVAHELCSLTFQPKDLDMHALVSGLIFGDGVAACVVRDNAEAVGMKLHQNASHLFENSHHYMGFDFDATGMHIVLDKHVPKAIDKEIAPVMREFLAGAGSDGSDVDFWCLHPGGRRVIDEIQKAFELGDGAVEPSRQTLREVGNLSSATVLVVLMNLFKYHRPEHGQRGLMAAMGPGFSVEMGLAEWHEPSA